MKGRQVIHLASYFIYSFTFDSSFSSTRTPRNLVLQHVLGTFWHGLVPVEFPWNSAQVRVAGVLPIGIDLRVDRNRKSIPIAEL